MNRYREAFLAAVVLLSGSGLAFGDYLERAWFSKGMKTLDIGVASHEVFKLQASCVQCHGAAHEEWKNSAHGKAWTNPVFQEGFAQERKNRCVHCHAPLEEQFAEYQSGKDHKLLDTGVNCVSCHVRDGKVHSLNNDSKSPHIVIADKTFGSPKYCAGCHDFAMIPTLNSAPAVAQSTYSEWLKYKESGGTKTCLNCHSSTAKHLFPGGKGPEALIAEAVTITWNFRNRSIYFKVKNSGAGHSFPTGDLFREAILEVSTDGKKTYKRAHRFGKTYSKHPSGLKLDTDTRLVAGGVAAVRFTVGPTVKKVHYRLVYFRIPEFQRTISDINSEAWSDIVVEGVATKDVKSEA